LNQTPSPHIYSVTELTQEIQDTIEGRFDTLWVEGEISNFTCPASGHYYMVLKDETAQIRAVMFRLQARSLKFVPEDGMHVIANGRIGIYPPRGEYQVILDYLEPMGLGALALAFEQLKERLAAQGVFDAELKRPLPFLPQRVAVITSPTGAAIRDFLKVIRRRFANLDITVVPVRVQGEEASPEIVKAMDLVNRSLNADVIVLTRGGGSLEDFWAFNQEAVALAIRRSRIPVVSAVGHEVDITISDLAADLRAPTPSAAAEMLIAEKESLLLRLREARERITSAVRLNLRYRLESLHRLARGIRDPKRRLADQWLRIDDMHSRLVRQARFTLEACRQGLELQRRQILRHSPLRQAEDLERLLAFHRTTLSRTMEGRLRDTGQALSLLQKRISDLSPLSVLKRGYIITFSLPEQKILMRASDPRSGNRISVLLGRGKLECLVEKVDTGKERSSR